MPIVSIEVFLSDRQIEAIKRAVESDPAWTKDEDWDWRDPLMAAVLLKVNEIAGE